jgi:8-hydroxy-5-deazaflavin:NADPH oxidoreductase
MMGHEGSKPSVGIIGDGAAGSAIAQGLRRAGYTVQTVGNEPERVKEVAKSSEVIVLAVPASARKAAIQEMDKGWKGKTLIDISNLVNEKLGFDGSLRKSGAEEVQGWAKEAKVVKAFNTVFAQNMSTGQALGERLTLLVAGDDGASKERVMHLGRDLGFEPMDAGPLENARWLETLGYLNIHLAYAQGLGPGWGIRFAGAKHTPSPTTGTTVGDQSS